MSAHYNVKLQMDIRHMMDRAVMINSPIKEINKPLRFSTNTIDKYEALETNNRYENFDTNSIFTMDDRCEWFEMLEEYY